MDFNLLIPDTVLLSYLQFPKGSLTLNSPFATASGTTFSALSRQGQTAIFIAAFCLNAMVSLIQLWTTELLPAPVCLGF